LMRTTEAGAPRVAAVASGSKSGIGEPEGVTLGKVALGDGLPPPEQPEIERVSAVTAVTARPERNRTTMSPPFPSRPCYRRGGRPARSHRRYATRTVFPVTRSRTNTPGGGLGSFSKRFDAFDRNSTQRSPKTPDITEPSSP
jgi:hypothetical protein